MHYPIAEDEEQRLAALASYQIFDTPAEDEFDDLSSFASAICNVPIALITFIDSERQTFKSHYGTELTENQRELSFCTYAIDSDKEIMIIPDARIDERFADNPIVTGPAQITFYAGVPLINEEGYALGTMCVFDHQTHELTAKQIKALKTLARQVVDKLELRRKVRSLELANHELLNANVLIQKFASMAAHDIKNPLSNILLSSEVLKSRYEKAKYEGCLKLIDLNISSSTHLIGLVEKMLDYSKSPSSLLSNRQHFSFHQLISKLSTMLIVPANMKINLPAEDEELYLPVIAVDQIMINLLSNAIRYNDKKNGMIDVRFKSDESHYRFEVADNGIGIPEAYHESIFSSNFTLDRTDRYHKKGTGIGLSTVKDLVNALDGTIHVKSVVGEGTTFFVNLKKLLP